MLDNGNNNKVVLVALVVVVDRLQSTAFRVEHKHSEEDIDVKDMGMLPLRKHILYSTPLVARLVVALEEFLVQEDGEYSLLTSWTNLVNPGHHQVFWVLLVFAPHSQ